MHARGGLDAPLDDVSPAISSERPPVPFRGDLRAGASGWKPRPTSSSSVTPARQPDDDMLVTWEIAGRSHADVYTFGAG
ncbi:MAG: hypothetical protein U0W40_17970 [Acidimicrobiia bacterium]